VERAPSHPDAWFLAYDEAPSPPRPRLRLFNESGAGASLHTRDTDCEVVFAGVLHNEKEVCGEQGEPFPPHRDVAALLCRAYRRWGKLLFPKLRGMFVVFVWDAKLGTLFCARDPMGLAPLFYARAGGELLFSSSPAALVQHPRVSCAVNRAALADHLCHRWPKLEETFWADVNRVPPGHLLRVTGGRLCSSRYWDPAPARTPLAWIGEAEVEQFGPLLRQAVRRCLRINPTAIYLSGGLDSVSVAAIATAQCRVKGLVVPLALSLAFPDSAANEETVQREVARRLELPQVFALFDDAVGPRGLLLAALEMSSTRPAPLLNTYYPAYHVLGSEGKRRGCHSILTGSGGDEWLSVTPYLAADLLCRGDLAGLYRLWRNLQRSYPLPRFAVLRNLLWNCGARPILVNMADTLAPALTRRVRSTKAIPTWLAPDPAVRQTLIRRAEEYPPLPRGQSFYVREMRRAFDHPLVSWEFEETFENGQHLGVTIQSPFLDADVVAFLCRVPPALLNRGGVAKGLVRQMVAEQFPGLGFERQKKVLATNFFLDRMLKEGAHAWQVLGGVPALGQLGLVDEAAVRLAVETILTQRQAGQAFRVWDLLNLESWVRPRI
jgi:asparagine synthase (glutamine-hydrolysing)